METIWLEIVLIAVAILANGFFAGSEIALVSARISRLAQLRHDGRTGAAKAMSLKESPERFLATIRSPSRRSERWRRLSVARPPSKRSLLG